MTTASPEKSTAENAEANMYSVNGLANLWVATYKAGQGSAALQHDIVGLLYEDILPPEVKEDFEKLERSFTVARPIVRRIINSAGHCKYTDVTQGAVDENFRRDVADIIRNPEMRARPGPATLLENILARDAHYMPAMKSEVPRTYGSGRGQYFSHATKYVLLAANSSHPAIDQLFTGLRPSFVELADKKMETAITLPGTENRAQIPKSFTLQDVVTAHLEGNNDDIEPVRTAFAELGIDSITV